MSEFPFQKPNFAVYFEPANSLLRISWQGEVSESDLKTGYEKALELLRQNPVNRILIDMSKRKLIIVGNPDALFGKMFSEALGIIGNTLFLALVVSQEEYFLSTDAQRFEHLKYADNQFFIVERFLTTNEAEAWLATVS